MPRTLSTERRTALSFSAVDTRLRGAPRSPTYPASRSLGRLPGAATTCSQWNEAALQRGGPFTLEPAAYDQPIARSRRAQATAAPHPPRCTCKPRLRSSPQPPRPPAPTSRSSPPAARGARGSVALTGASLTLRLLRSGRDRRSRSARLLQRPRAPRRSL